MPKKKLLPRQLHAASSRWNGVLYPSKYRQTRLPEDLASCCKFCGGFWTSSETTEGSCAWLSMCEHEAAHFMLPKDPSICVYDVVGSPKILTIKNDTEFVKAVKKVGIPVCTENLGVNVHKGISPQLAMQFWPLAMQRWDAVHVPEIFERHKLLELWDVESTVWFRPQLHLKLISRTQSIV